MNFGKAIKKLKEGKKVARAGWNGKAMFIYLVEGTSVSANMQRGAASKHNITQGVVKICSHIDMKAADGSIVIGWLASQTDMLADDWEVK